MGEQTLDGLAILDEAEVAHELGPETRINQVKNGVLDAADVLVDSLLAKPVAGNLGIKRSALVVRIGVAIEIPGGIDECVHGVGFATGGTATFRTLRVQEFWNLYQW